MSKHTTGEHASACISSQQYRLMDWTKRCVFLITSNDGGVLLDMDNDQFLKLDTIAAEMWRSLAAGATEEQVAVKIAEKCEVDGDQVFQDVRNLRFSRWA